MFSGFSALIQPEPGPIAGPLSFVFGHIINFIYMGLEFLFTPVNALGFSIIIITFIVRGALVPSQLKMQQMGAKTRAAKPEMDKVRAKYGDTRDPELRRKMAAEIQAINQKHGINMLASCLPLLVTMPIFIGLFAVFGRAFMFIPSIAAVYSDLSAALIGLGSGFHNEVLRDIILPYTANVSIDPRVVEEMNRAIHVFSQSDWDTIFSNLVGTQYETIRYLYEAKLRVETFFGLNLVTVSGWAWPGIIIPILSAGTMAFSSWQNSRINPTIDPQQKMIQRVMIFVLPLMFGWFTATAAAAVGLYWTMGNVFLIIQNFVVVKYFPHKIGLAQKPEKDDRDRRDRRDDRRDRRDDRRDRR
jgi:YidC/Oxa1 family membrane protein insertase